MANADYTMNTPVNQRTESRASTVFRPVLIETDGFFSFCLVRNISSKGLMGDVYASFAEGLRISIQFGSKKKIAGRLIWNRMGRIGVEFDEEIDLAKVLSDLGQKVVDGEMNRAPRLPMFCNGELEVDGRTLRVEVLDISQSGLKVRADFIRPSDEVLALLNGMGRRKAIVRWTHAGAAGVNFIQPLSFKELAQWVISQQSGENPTASSAETGGKPTTICQNVNAGRATQPT